MKKIKTFWMLFTTLLLISSCSKAQEASDEKDNSLKNTSILIVYLSRTKNTKTVAEIIHKTVGGKLVALELKNPYPVDYKITVEQVQKENETGFLPPLKTKIDDIEKYDVIFIGFPTWGMQLPPPMKSFLKEYNLEGKIVIPFNTHAGYGVGSSFETLKKLANDSKVLKGFSVEGGKEREGILFVMEGEKEIEVQAKIQQWLKQLNLL